MQSQMYRSSGSRQMLLPPSMVSRDFVRHRVPAPLYGSRLSGRASAGGFKAPFKMELGP